MKVVDLPLASRSVSHLTMYGWGLTISFVCMTFIPRSFDHTMFVDGLAYAAISRNMAEGLGTFWRPYFADSFWLAYNNRCDFFCEHPPLMFWIQSVLFRIFGDSTAVENGYNLIVLIASIYFISLIWKELFVHNEILSANAWLPVLLWYGLRVVWWSVPNNLLDTTMAVFCLASVFFQLQALAGGKMVIVRWITAGLMVFLACMIKGPVGLFPLAFPVIYAVVQGSAFYKRALVGLVLICGSFLLLFFGLMLYPPANFFLKNYFQGQVMQALLKKRERVTTGWTAHIYLVMLLLTNIIPHLLLLAGINLFRFFAKLNAPASVATRKVRIIMLLVALSGILPMLASVKQADYYLMPALPFVAIFFAACVIELLILFTDRFERITKTGFPIAAIVLAGVTCYKLYKPDFDRNYEISMALSRNIPKRSKIYLPKRISMESQLHTAFQRYASLSIAFEPAETQYYFFEIPGDLPAEIAEKCEVIELGNGAKLGVRK